MATQPLPRFLERHREHQSHARARATVPVPDVPEVPAGRHRYAPDPGDTLTLRGIPAIGRGVAGCIRGTNPEAAAV